MKQDQNWTVTIWGVRGAFPVAAADFLAYGGNTSCISVRCGKELVVFDAGSGILRLGDALSEQDTPGRIHILIGHLHLDHILGLIGFPFLHCKTAEIHLYGEAGEGVSFRERLDRLFGPPYWPVGLKDSGAGLVFHEIGPDRQFSLAEGLTVHTLRSCHPDQCLLYRLEGMGRSIVYALDCELMENMDERLTKFARGCGLLIWDANFAPDELERGWGHSTWEQGISLRRAAGVEKILMSHFSHAYTDRFLREQEKLAGEQDSHLCFAREGMVISL